MNPNNYKNQKLRGLKRKYEIFISRGGKCEMCGYNKNLSALEFHHLNPKEKETCLDVRKLSNSNLENLEKDLSKCILLCSNCHRELHHPDQTIANIPKILEKAKNKKSFRSKGNPGKVCPVCGNRFPSSKGKIYCSEECRNFDRFKDYPTIDKIEESYKTLHSWEKVARSFGLTRRIIQGIRKRSSK